MSILDTLKFPQEKKEKKAFYASDYGKPLLDIYLTWKGVEQTNPPEWYESLKWHAGSGVEEGIVKILKLNGIVPEDYNQKEHGRIEIQREGVQINGYIDAKMKDGTPIEVKSINNANKFDIKKYEMGMPRENYVGQLSIYLDALGLDKGHLFVSSIDGLNRFWFDCVRVKDRIFRCGNVEVNLDEQYKKWADLYTNNIQKDAMPDVFEHFYKIPIDRIDWSEVSKTDISKARNGQKVIGDWQVQYSNYKDMIVSLQGETLGYTPEEMEFIKKATKGYSTWE